MDKTMRGRLMFMVVRTMARHSIPAMTFGNPKRRLPRLIRRHSITSAGRSPFRVTRSLWGVPGDGDPNQSGTAHVFQRTGGNWVQQQTLTAADAAYSDNFGWSVAISGDTAIAGSLRDGDLGPESGSAYIFQRSGSIWSQQAKLTPADGQTGDRFGESLSISGETVVVGAHLDDDLGDASGSAYVFNRSGASWSQQAKLTPADGAASDEFGFAVSISGETVVVGSFKDDDLGSASGSAYVFERSGTSWSQQAKLTTADGALGDFVGESVSISGDALVLGSRTNDEVANNSGAAYIFERHGSSWSQASKLIAEDGAAVDMFGAAVAISGDTVVVGAHLDDLDLDGDSVEEVNNAGSVSRVQKGLRHGE